jgi:hypothetical protein
MSQKLFQGRWTPGPDAAEIALLKKKQYAAVIVWRCMLRDALQAPEWRTSLSIADITKETRLSKNTIMQAQHQLLKAGYMTRESGGGKTRKTAVWTMTAPQSYGSEKVQQQKPTFGEWQL